MHQEVENSEASFLVEVNYCLNSIKRISDFFLYEEERGYEVATQSKIKIK